MKNEMNLEQFETLELTLEEKNEVEGGFLPLVVIGGCWAVMAVCSAAALGMRNAAKDNGANIW
jgi:hypothetical protein